MYVCEVFLLCIWGNELDCTCGEGVCDTIHASIILVFVEGNEQKQHGPLILSHVALEPTTWKATKAASWPRALVIAHLYVNITMMNVMDGS